MRRANPEEPKDPTKQTAFGGVVVSPAVQNPAALAYAKAATGRHPPKYTTPVAGGPTGPIPRLDAPAGEGLTMADQAVIQRGPSAAPAPAPLGGIFAGAEAAQPAPPSRVPANNGLLMTDILPPEALQDPAFREGQGSNYAIAQPELAFKYGVIRNNKKVPPQQIAQAQPGLSAKTLEGLQALQAAQAGPRVNPLIETEDQRLQRESAGTAAGAAGRLGNTPGESPATKKMTTEEAAEAVKNLDDFDFNALKERMMKDLLNNEDQRVIIEARCKPLNVADLIVNGVVTQRVPVIPTQFEPEFQSMGADEDLAIKRLIMLEGKQLDVGERYLLDKFSLMSVTIGTRSINGNLLPSHLDDMGRFNDEKFWAKFNFITHYPFHMLASLGVNYYWFDIRVRKLFVAENLGNG